MPEVCEGASDVETCSCALWVAMLSRHQGAQQGHTGAYLNARIRAGIGLSLSSCFVFGTVSLAAARPRITWVPLIQRTRHGDSTGQRAGLGRGLRVYQCCYPVWQVERMAKLRSLNVIDTVNEAPHLVVLELRSLSKLSGHRELFEQHCLCSA